MDNVVLTIMENKARIISTVVPVIAFTTVESFIFVGLKFRGFQINNKLVGIKFRGFSIKPVKCKGNKYFH